MVILGELCIKLYLYWPCRAEKERTLTHFTHRFYTEITANIHMKNTEYFLYFKDVEIVIIISGYSCRTFLFLLFPPRAPRRTSRTLRAPARLDVAPTLISLLIVAARLPQRLFPLSPLRASPLTPPFFLSAGREPAPPFRRNNENLNSKGGG